MHNKRGNQANPEEELKSTVEKLMDAAKQREEVQELNEQELKQVKDAFNRVFDSDDGALVFKYIQSCARIYNFERTLNPVELATLNGRRQVYGMLRILATPELREKLERG